MAKTLQSPGAFLTLLLEKHNLNPFKLSKDINLSQSAVRLIALGKTRVSVPVALRLAKYFNTNAEYWLMMQMRWDLVEATKDKDLMNVVKNISQFKKEPAAKKAVAAKKPAAKPAAKAPAAKKPEAQKKPAVKAGAKPAATPKAGSRSRPAAK